MFNVKCNYSWVIFEDIQGYDLFECSNSYRFYIYQKNLFIIVKYTSGIIYKKIS